MGGRDRALSPRVPKTPAAPQRDPTARPKPHRSPGLTLNWGPRLEPQGCAEAGPVVEAPALLHLGGAGGLGDVLGAGGAVQGGPQVLPAPAALPLRVAQPDAVLDAHLVAARESGVGSVSGYRGWGGWDGDGDREGSRALLWAHIVPTTVGVRMGRVVLSSWRAPSTQWVRACVPARPGAGGTPCPRRTSSGVTLLNTFFFPFFPQEQRKEKTDGQGEWGESGTVVGGRWQSNRPHREQPCSCPDPAGTGCPGAPGQAPSSSSSSSSRLHHLIQALLLP